MKKIIPFLKIFFQYFLLILAISWCHNTGRPVFLFDWTEGAVHYYSRKWSKDDCEFANERKFFDQIYRR